MNPSEHDIASFASIVFYVMGTISAVIMAYASLKRSPPIESEIANIGEKLRGHLDVKLVELDAQLEQRFSGMSKKVGDSITKTENALKEIIDRDRQTASDRMDKIDDRIDALDESRQADTKQLLQDIGRLQTGKVDKK